MTIEQIIQYIFSGITVGSIYAIVAIGFNIIYNATGIINFAQGEFVMLGGMIAYTVNKNLSILITYKPASLFLSIIIAVIITIIIGALLEIIFIRKLKKPSVLQMIVITIGLSIIIREIALHVWDDQPRALPFFTGSEISSINVFGAYISPQVLWIIGITALIVIVLNLFFKYTINGQAMRACSANKTSASLCGINIKNMVTLSFILSAGIGALAGCVVAPLSQTSYDMGTGFAIKGFTVAIFGGLGNSTAALAAGLLLGILEAFSISIIPNAYKDAIAIIILLFVLFFKPSGLFVNKQKGELKEF
jgi:branched-chain amino acid transport system permease protein